MPELRVLPAARRDLDSLDPPIFRRVKSAILALASNPRPAGAIRLTGSGGLRIRVGDYRVLYRIDDAAGVVYIYRVKHRREACR